MTTEQVITDLLAYCTRTNHTLKFSPGEVVREVRDSGSRFHTAAELANLVHEGEGRRFHEELTREVDRTLTGGSRQALQDANNASKAVLARESGA